MIRDDLSVLIERAIKTAQEKGELPRFEPPPVTLVRPKDETHGDYATPVCMNMARLARMAPVAIAEKVVKHLKRPEAVGSVQIAHPGFINIALAPAWVAAQVEIILQQGDRFGHVDVPGPGGGGRRAQVEYISANPTGPLTIGAARNAALGDTLANVLAAAGWQLQREYYVNDIGTQMELFAASLHARYAQALGHDVPLPENGYPGSYLADMGQAVAADFGDRFLRMERPAALEALRIEGLRRMLDSIRADAEALGIHFDVWKSEQSLYDEGVYGTVFNRLSQAGWLVHREGAVWFKNDRESADSPAAGAQPAKSREDKDNVVVRSDGRPTYFASDIAYVWDKLVKRGFDWAIYVWGADHHGHVPRMKAVTRALELDPERVTFILYQLVTLKRAGQLVRMGKRTGEIITLREVIEEIGADATRFMLLTRSADSQMELDLTLAAQQSSENPVYYVQYGHARIASIFRYALEHGVQADGGDVGLLTHPAEQALIRHMLRLPETVALCAETISPHHLTHYAQELAAAFHSFYKECRVVSDDPAHAELAKARLKLVLAAKIVLANTLRLIGVSAPESM